MSVKLIIENLTQQRALKKFSKNTMLNIEIGTTKIIGQK